MTGDDIGPDAFIDDRGGHRLVVRHADGVPLYALLPDVGPVPYETWIHSRRPPLAGQGMGLRAAGSGLAIGIEVSHV